MLVQKGAPRCSAVIRVWRAPLGPLQRVQAAIAVASAPQACSRRHRTLRRSAPGVLLVTRQVSLARFIVLHAWLAWLGAMVRALSAREVPSRRARQVQCALHVLMGNTRSPRRPRRALVTSFLLVSLPSATATPTARKVTTWYMPWWFECSGLSLPPQPRRPCSQRPYLHTHAHTCRLLHAQVVRRHARHCTRRHTAPRRTPRRAHRRACQPVRNKLQDAA